YLSDHVVIQSALFGPIRATDYIPQYRLSASSVLSSFSTTRFWRPRLHGVLDGTGDLFLDLRAKQYQALAPITTRTVVDLEIVRRADDGSLRALNHFNKQAKGEIIARLLKTQAEIKNIDD